MRTTRVFQAMFFIVITSGLFAQTDERLMSREARISAHREKIEDIIRANKLVQLNRSETSGISSLINVSEPKMFEKQNVPLLKQEIATEEQIQKLREANQKLWDLRVHAHEATAPQVSAKVKPLLRELETILTPDQEAAYAEAYRKHMEEMKKRMNLPKPPEN